MAENQDVKNPITEKLGMKAVSCPSCGARMKRNGRTGAGAQGVEVRLLRRLDDALLRRQ